MRCSGRLQRRKEDIPLTGIATYTILLSYFSFAIFTVKVVFVRLDHLANLSKFLCSMSGSTMTGASA
jgi:hypothetical protein